MKKLHYFSNRNDEKFSIIRNQVEHFNVEFNFLISITYQTNIKKNCINIMIMIFIRFSLIIVFMLNQEKT